MKDKHFTYLLILAMLLWGGGWSALKILTPNSAVEVIVFWRFLIMSLSFLPILFFIKQPIIVNKTNTTFILSSSLLNIAFMVSSFFGVKYGLAGGGGVIITTLSPVMTFLLMVLFFRKKLHNIQYFGLFIGIIGGYIMLELNSPQQFFDGSNIYFLLSATIWAGVTILSQYSHRHIHPIHYSFLISIVSTVIIYFYSFNSDLMSVFNQSTEFWIAMIYLAVLGQSVATTIFFMASGKLGSEKSSSFMFLVPAFALLIAWLVLNEEMQAHILIGGAISLLAVYFVNKKR